MEDVIKLLSEQYDIAEDEIVQFESRLVIKKPGIKKILNRTNTVVEVNQMVVREVSKSGIVEDAVYLTGVARRRNRRGFIVKEVPVTASATPFNCSFPYKLETAQARLESRGAIAIAELNNVLGVDELNIPSFDEMSSDSIGDKLIEQSLKKMSSYDRK